MEPDDKPKAEADRPPARKGGANLFWYGILAGVLIVAVVFHRSWLELLRDAFGNVMPVFFTPGLLEISLGVIGFGIVILVNYLLLRREAQDEWVELPDDE